MLEQRARGAGGAKVIEHFGLTLSNGNEVAFQGSAIFGYALIFGLVMGAIGQVLVLTGGVFAVLGDGAAIWATMGYLLARQASAGRTTYDGIVWTGSAVSVYLLAWVFSHCAVRAVLGASSFSAAYGAASGLIVFAPVAAAALGAVAVLSKRAGWLGAACLAAPLAWSLPEMVARGLEGWQYAVVVSIPTLVVALVALRLTWRKGVNWLVFAGACLVGGGATYCILTLISCIKYWSIVW